MEELIYKIIEGINREIGAVPVDKEGFYSPGSQMFVAGLYRAKDIVQRIAKEADDGKTT